MRILMVCLGNICRSPMADGLLRKKVKALNLKVTVDSAGTSAVHQGEQPDHRMRNTARELGTPIDELRSRPFVSEDFDRFDLIYAMDKNNKRNILSLARSEDHKRKVLLILNELDPGMDQDVPDPFYGDQQDFTHVYQMLDQATDRIIERITTNE